MKKIITTAAICALITGFSTLAQAEEEKNKGHIVVGLGVYDILNGDEAADLRIEYRPDHSYWKELKPWAGAEITTDGTLWGGGGLLYDYEFSPKWHVIPNIGVGLYAQGDSDLDLGHAIEFRSQLEVAYELENANRVGLAFGHISNAGLDSENPGTEVLNAYYHIGF